MLEESDEYFNDAGCVEQSSKRVNKELARLLEGINLLGMLWIGQFVPSKINCHKR